MGGDVRGISLIVDFGGIARGGEEDLMGDG